MNSPQTGLWRRPWIWLFIVLGLLAVPFLYIAVKHMGFEARIARIRAAGDPISIAQVESDRKPAPDEDCTSLWLQAMNAYAADWKSLSDEDRKRFLALPCIDCGDPIPSPDDAWPELLTAIQCLKSQSRAMALIEEASKKGGKASLPRTRGEYDFGLRNQTSEHRMLCWLVELRTVSDLYQHQPEQAADSIKALLSLVRSIENQPTCMDGGLTNRYRKAAYRLLAELCSQPNVSSESLLQFEKQIKSDDLLREQRWVFASERAYAVDVFFRRPFAFPYWLERSDYLDLMDEMCHLSEEDWPKVLNVATPNNSKRRGVLTAHVHDSCMSMLPSSARVESARRLTLVALSARRFLADNHKPPASIDDLIPSYLQERPTDVYGNDTVRLSSTTDEVLISCQSPSKATNKEPVSKPAKLEIRFRISPLTPK